jgi:type III secretion protein T
MLENIDDISNYGVALAIGCARILGCVTFIPLFMRQNITRLVRNGICIALSLPFSMKVFTDIHEGAVVGSVFALAFKEALVGVALGLMLSAPFIAFLGVGVIIDNQRGGNGAQQTNPSMPADASILGDLFQRVVMMIAVETGLFIMIIQIINQSYLVWPALDWSPSFTLSALTLHVPVFTQIIRTTLLFAAPIVLLLILVELVLALVGMSSQGVQTSELSTPVKGFIALFALALSLDHLYEVIYKLNYDWLFKILIDLKNGH